MAKQQAADRFELVLRKAYFGCAAGGGEKAAKQEEGKEGETKAKEGGDPSECDIDHLGLKPIDSQVLQRWIELQQEATEDLCETYTSGLDALANVSRYSHDSSTNLFNVAQIILGLTGTAATTLAMVATAEAGLDTQWNATERFIFLAPEPYLVKQAVVREMKEYKQQHPLSSITTYVGAREWMREHASNCTPSGLRKVVADGLAGAASGPVVRESLSRAGIVLDSVRKAIGGTFHTQVFDDDLVAIYWYFMIAADASKEERDAALEEIKNLKNAPLSKAVTALIGKFDTATTEYNTANEAYEKETDADKKNPLRVAMQSKKDTLDKITVNVASLKANLQMLQSADVGGVDSQIVANAKSKSGAFRTAHAPKDPPPPAG